MNLMDRLSRIKERPTRASLVWNERTEPVAREAPVPNLVSVNGKLTIRPCAASTPNDRRIVFVDFCPGGVVVNRLDIAWLQQGICTYDHFSSEEQWEAFQSIRVGDRIVMKRDFVASQTSRLCAHGRVVGWDLNENRDRVLLVDWSDERGQIEVPLITCNNLLKIQNIDEVEATMPAPFRGWLAS